MKIGLLGILGTIFVVLKLVGAIGWAWWLVLLPFILCFASWVLVFVFAVIGLAAVGSKK